MKSLKCEFKCNVGANSQNVVSRTLPHFYQSMLTPMVSTLGDHDKKNDRGEQPSGGVTTWT